MKIRVCAAVLLALVVAGCGGGGSGVVAVNNPPSISFTFTPIGVPHSVPVDLTASVHDEDADDVLKVTWQITRGTLTPKNAAKTTMEWAVPDELGADTVVVSVTDGEDTRTTTQVLKVGTIVRETPLASYTLAQSPYILHADNDPPRLLVGNGDQSNVEAGVEILVDVPGTLIDVTGRLNLNGTADLPVVIRPNDRGQPCSTNRSWWEGIVAGTDQTFDGVVTIDHAEIWNAKDGVRIRDAARATITNSTIKCCGENGILMQGGGTLVVTGCEVSNTQINGITVSALTLLPQSVSITGCNITINDNAGVSLDLPDFSADVPITITGNYFEFNFVYGITMRNWVWPVIHNNSFYSNGSQGLSNIWLQSPFHDSAMPDTIDVSCNYWGAAVSSRATIENTIHDRLDSPILGTRLLVVPWLNSDPYQAETPPPCDGGITR